MNLRLTVGTVLFGKSNGSDLGDLEAGPVTTMFFHPEVFAKTLWDVFSRQFVDDGIETDQDLFDLLDGTVLRDAEKAMRTAIADFFPWGQQVIDKVDEKLATIGDLLNEMEEQSGPQSGDPPESSE